jgi:glycosidase
VAEPPQPSGAAAYERLAVAVTVLFTNRSAPLIYDGDEIGLAGAGDPDNHKFRQWGSLPANQETLRDKVKTRTAVRAAHFSLRHGRRSPLDAQDDLWLYRMTTTGDDVFVLVNRADAERSTSALPGGNDTELLVGATASGGAITIPARSARIDLKP